MGYIWSDGPNGLVILGEKGYMCLLNNHPSIFIFGFLFIYCFVKDMWDRTGGAGCLGGPMNEQSKEKQIKKRQKKQKQKQKRKESSWLYGGAAAQSSPLTVKDHEFLLHHVKALL